MNVIAPRTKGTLLTPKVVGLIGAAGSGKTTAAAILARHGYQIAPFAKPLKDMIRAAGLTEREINGDQKELPLPLLCGKSPRFALQTLGTEWGRNLIGPDFWVNLWLAQTGGRRVVADDVRFPNEVEAIRRRDGIVVRIERPDIIGTPHRDHLSEAALREFEADSTIINDGSVVELREKIMVAVFGCDVEPLLL